MRAAGCWTSSSEMMVAVSEVTKSFSRWLMTILFIPAQENTGNGRKQIERIGLLKHAAGTTCSELIESRAFRRQTRLVTRSISCMASQTAHSKKSWHCHRPLDKSDRSTRC